MFIFKIFLLFLTNLDYARPMDREPSLSPSGHALTTGNSPPRTSALDNFNEGIGPRLLGITIPDSSNHLEQKDDLSNLTKAQIYRKKNYMKLRTNEKAWEEYKIKRNEYRKEKRKEQRKEKSTDIQRMYESRMLKWKMKQDKDESRTKTTATTNARSRFYKNYEKGIATKEDLKKYMDLLERDKNYQKLSRQQKKNKQSRTIKPLDVGPKSTQTPVSPSMWDEVWHKDNEHNNLQDGHMHHAIPNQSSPDNKTNEELHKSELLKLKKSRTKVYNDTWMQKLRKDKQKYAAFRSRKREYEKERRKGLLPEKKALWNAERQKHQQRHYKLKVEKDPNFKRINSRTRLRQKIEQNIATEKDLERYNKIKERDRLYQKGVRERQKAREEELKRKYNP